MSVESRLTAEQLTALPPGDTVIIEAAPGDRRPTRITGDRRPRGPAEILVSSGGRGGGKFVERFRRRDGVRLSSGAGAELVIAEAVEAGRTGQRREMQRINDLYWA